MILEKQKEAIILETGGSKESIGMSLDLDSAQILMQMLSKNLYSDSIGSTIRECASNALDSHRRAGMNKPIVVCLQPTDARGYEFSVEDFGIGLDADDVQNIISKYGKSTKRNSSTELGMMGLGFKAPLAYTSSFYFIARKDGIERKYMMYEGEEVNTIDLLYQRETEESNGVKVIIPISHHDKYDFVKKIKEQLAYFENVYFNVIDTDIKNDFIIFKGEDFQFSEIATDSKLHICLDNVYYPLDFSKIGTDVIDFPIALRFGLNDGIFPTPNRESIRYTPEAKKTILKKIESVSNYFVNKYNENVNEVDDIETIMNYYYHNNKTVSSFGKKYNINNIVTFATVKSKYPTLNGVTKLNFKEFYLSKDYWFSKYSCKIHFERGKLQNVKTSYSYFFTPNRILDCIVYLSNGRVSGLQKDYLKFLSKSNSGKTTIVVSPNKDLSLGTLLDEKHGHYNCYRNILNLKDHPKSEWRARIRDFKYIVSLFSEKWINLDELQIPQQFIDSRKKPKSNVNNGPGKRRKITGEVVGKKAEQLLRFVEGSNCKWVSSNFNLENLTKSKEFTVYSSHSDAKELDKLYSLFPTQYVNFVTFSDKELKIMKEVSAHNWMSYEEFMKGKHIMFRRVVTANLIKTLKTNYRSIFDRNHNFIQELSTKLYNSIDEVDEYQCKWYVSGGDSTILKLLEISKNNNWYDGNIYETFVQLESMFKKYTFISTITRLLTSYSYNATLDPMSDLFKYHKLRLNLNRYKSNVIEEVIEE